MGLSLVIVLGIMGTATGIAATHRRNGYLIGAAIVSWLLVLCFALFEPTTILIPTRAPLTADFFEYLFTLITVILEIAGLYTLFTRR